MSGIGTFFGLRNKLRGISIIVCLIVAIGFALAFQSRLSCAVALIYKGEVIQRFLQKPGVSYVETQFMIRPDFPSDVIFGVDQELIEGIKLPHYVKGGDWMSFVGLQRSGSVWIAEGTAETMRGVPSKERKWKILTLGEAIKPDVWYRIRCYCDYQSRCYNRLEVQGPGLLKKFDLTGVKLDYPNFMPFDGRAMSYYTYAMRSRTMIKVGESGEPLVYFDDVKGGVVVDGVERLVFTNDFESQSTVDGQPVTSPVISLSKYEQGRFYKERDEAKFRIVEAGNAHSGRHVGVADAGL